MKRPIACLLLVLSPLTGAASDQPICHDTSDYRVIEAPTENVGTHFLIKYKTVTSPDPECRYVVADGDFELRNEDAEYFLGLTGDLLILDSGTGPEPRGLIIWNLHTRTKVYSGRYADASLEASAMTFWIESGAATDANCPEAAEWRTSGLGAVIETRVRLDFGDFKLTRSSATRCQARQ